MSKEELVRLHVNSQTHPSVSDSSLYGCQEWFLKRADGARVQGPRNWSAVRAWYRVPRKKFYFHRLNNKSVYEKKKCGDTENVPLIPTYVMCCFEGSNRTTGDPALWAQWLLTCLFCFRDAASTHSTGHLWALRLDLAKHSSNSDIVT